MLLDFYLWEYGTFFCIDIGGLDSGYPEDIFYLLIFFPFLYMRSIYLTSRLTATGRIPTMNFGATGLHKVGGPDGNLLSGSHASWL